MTGKKGIKENKNYIKEKKWNIILIFKFQVSILWTEIVTNTKSVNKYFQINIYKETEEKEKVISTMTTKQENNLYEYRIRYKDLFWLCCLDLNFNCSSNNFIYYSYVYQ